MTNCARLLQTLDFDQDPSNGIEIVDSVRQAAVGVTMAFQQDPATFTTGEQANTDILTAGLPGGPRTLVATQEARDHLANTLRTIVAGRYDGSFAGDDNGPFSVYVDREGVLYGWAFSLFDGIIALFGSADKKGGFVAGNASTGATFMGQIEADGSLTGTWDLAFETGTFSGRRTIPLANLLDEDLIEMLAGQYDGTFVSNFGSEPFTMFLDDDGNVSLPVPDDQISGTVISTSGTTAELRALTDEGCQIMATVDAGGSLSGSFQNDLTGEVGTFTAMRL